MGGMIEVLNDAVVPNYGLLENLYNGNQPPKTDDHVVSNVFSLYIMIRNASSSFSPGPFFNSSNFSQFSLDSNCLECWPDIPTQFGNILY